MTDHDLEQDLDVGWHIGTRWTPGVMESAHREEAWATSLGFHSAADYHQASDEAFQARIDELCLFEGNVE